MDPILMHHVELDLERRAKAREYRKIYRAAHPEVIRAQKQRYRARIMERGAEDPQVRERNLEYYRVYNEVHAAARQAYYEIFNERRRARRAEAGATPRARLPRGMGEAIVRA